MIYGVPLATFTLLHVIISAVAIVSGLVVLFGMLGSHGLPRWTALFLFATVLTSVTGFYFPGTTLTPARIFGIASLVVLVPTLLARYAFRLRGAWRWIYVGGAVIVLYLNVFVLVVQSFAKVPELQPLAPTQSEPPFLIAHAAVLGVFVLLGIAALLLFHPERKRARTAPSSAPLAPAQPAE
jgi:hypothetical protein